MLLPMAVMVGVLLALSGCGVAFSPAAGSGGPNAAPPPPAPTFTPRPEVLQETAKSYAGGRYTLQVPSNWNGGLVLYAHGYQGEGPRGDLENPPLDSVVK